MRRVLRRLDNAALQLRPALRLRVGARQTLEPILKVYGEGVHWLSFVDSLFNRRLSGYPA